MGNRLLTRGLGERTQIRELRQAQYPQMGQEETILPDAANTTIAGTDIVCIRGSGNTPLRIDSSNRGTYLRINKGESGFGLRSFRNNDVPTPGTYSYSFASKHDEPWRNKGFIISFTINSDHDSTLVTRTYVGASVLSNSPFTNARQIQVHRKNPREFPVMVNESSIDAMSYLKGGVNNLLSLKRGSGFFDYQQFNNQILNLYTDVSANRLILSSVSNPRFSLQLSAISMFGFLSYSESNTIRNGNVSWLLKQRTQYQRRFNPLKNLGT